MHLIQSFFYFLFCLIQTIWNFNGTSHENQRLRMKLSKPYTDSFSFPFKDVCSFNPKKLKFLFVVCTFFFSLAAFLAVSYYIFLGYVLFIKNIYFSLLYYLSFLRTIIWIFTWFNYFWKNPECLIHQ